MKNLPKINPAKALKASLPYLIAGLLCTKLGEAYRLTTSGDVIDRLLAAFTKLGLVFQNPFPSLHPFDLLVGAAAAVLLRLVVWSKIKNAKKYRHGEEYGTARWGNEKDIAPFINSDFSQNILLTDTERLTLGKIADPEKRNVNLNVLVIGGSGSGKTRYHIKPNLLQMNASYVCSDPKGTVVEEVGRALVQQGHYKLKILNTIDFGCSMHYNPFHYLHSETDILSLVTVIMENTQSKEGKGGDDFWSKAEALLYQALIAYIYYEAPEEEKNMTTLLDMLNACECREDDENFKSAVDLLFEQLEQRDANHFAVRQYKKFKMAAGNAGADLFLLMQYREERNNERELHQSTAGVPGAAPAAGRLYLSGNAPGISGQLVAGGADDPFRSGAGSAGRQRRLRHPDGFAGYGKLPASV